MISIQHTDVKFPGSLHNHTDYSNLRLRDCINKVSDLIDYAIELGHSGIAITDHETISSHIKIEKYAKKIAKSNPDFKIIRGNEIYLVRNGLTGENYDTHTDRYFHFILLAKDAIGHKQIREISTRAWRRSYMARGMRRVPTYYQDIIDIIGANPGHVIGSTACLGGFLATKALQYANSQSEDDYNYLIAWSRRMESIFTPGHFFFELQPSPNKEQKVVNRVLIQLSNELNIPYIVTTDSHYLKKEDKVIHKAFLNSQDGEREIDSFYATTYLMGDEEIRDFLIEMTKEEIDIGFKNIQNIMDSCTNYSLSKPLKIPRLPWREVGSKNIDQAYWGTLIPYLGTFWSSEYEGDQILANAIVDKIQSNTQLMDRKIYDAINECLEMTWVSSEVNKTHWSAYYLNLQKIIEECWKAGTLVGPGRGSGVGFILLYLLDIIQINPLWETTQTFSWRLTRKG